MQKQNFNSTIVLPYEFRITKDRKLLAVANSVPNVLFIDTTSFNQPFLLSVWDN